MSRLSLCLIAKNEEANLPACLRSVADLVDEMIIVDTGSTDRTKAVAASCGARVFDFAWVDSFAAARNASLEPARGDWVLWLDGDERFDATNRQKLRALRAELRDDGAAYVMKQSSTPEGGRGTPTVVDQVRLFRNLPEIRWRYRVHEQILPAVRQAGHEVRFTDIAIAHVGYEDPALRRHKTQRNLRLLLLERDEQPDDPFTLFNLGWTLLEMGETAQAVPLLRRSLEGSQPGDSIVRKLYALLAQAHLQLGEPWEALAACRAGLARCPDDAELLYVESQVCRGQRDFAGAEASLRRLLHVRPGTYFASQDTGLRGSKARHQLATLYREQGRAADAEREWLSAVGAEPNFTPAWQGLGELYLEQARWADLERAALELGRDGDGVVEAAVLRGRAALVRAEYGAARAVLETALGQHPQAVRPRLFLSHVLLQEGQDPTSAERVLRDLLRLDPGQMGAWHNLAVLLSRQGRRREALGVCADALDHCPGDVDLLLEQGVLRREEGDLTGSEKCLLRFLEGGPSTAVGDRTREQHATARHQLALIYRQQRRQNEAEAQWRAVMAERPDFLPACLGLADLYLGQRRWAEVEQIARHLENGAHNPIEGAVLRARGHLARRDFASARAILRDAIAAAPDAVWPRITLSHILLQEGRDWEAAEQALRDVLALEPGNGEARHNLDLLLQQRRRPEAEPTAQPLEDASLADLPSAALGHDRIPAEPVSDSAERLRIAFACYSPFTVRTEMPYQEPLGGSESALCYLAEALARQGHLAFLLNAGREAVNSGGVHCLPLTDAVIRQLPPLDAFVVLNCAGRGTSLRQLLQGPAHLVLWSQHADDQPAMQPLRDAAERAAYDHFVLVSDWQRRRYQQEFGLDPRRVVVLRNGVSPSFEGLWPAHEPLLAAKVRPPLLAYTSTPYRGLDRLLDAFPRIRAAVPGTRLKVFSSMKVYRVSADAEESRFGSLYQRCSELEGVDYVGSLPQASLARELRSVSVLAYPNTFAETSCIAALEALASGCWVVTSDRGALPETTAGFARLVPVECDHDGGASLGRFVEATVDILTTLAGGSEATEAHLRAQVEYVNRHGTWPVIAWEWARWLGTVRAGSRELAEDRGFTRAGQ